MKTEADMQTEGRKIARAIDNYTPIHQNRGEAEAQATLQEATR